MTQPVVRQYMYVCVRVRVCACACMHVCVHVCVCMCVNVICVGGGMCECAVLIHVPSSGSGCSQHEWSSAITVSAVDRLEYRMLLHTSYHT